MFKYRLPGMVEEVELVAACLFKTAIEEVKREGEESKGAGGALTSGEVEVEARDGEDKGDSGTIVVEIESACAG